MLRSVFLAIAVLLFVVPAATPVQATSSILRCQSPDGTLVYTDKACSAFGAKSAPIPGDLLTRIYHDESRYADADDPIPASALPAAARRDPSRGCARTTTQLAMDLRASLALGDVNRVAESYHWVGMSSRQGELTLDRLQALTGKPVLDSHYFDARIGASTLDGTVAGALASNADIADIGGDAGILQLVLGGASDAGRSAVDFDVHHYAGCYFVTF